MTAADDEREPRSVYSWPLEYAERDWTLDNDFLDLHDHLFV